MRVGFYDNQTDEICEVIHCEVIHQVCMVMKWTAVLIQEQLWYPLEMLGASKVGAYQTTQISVEEIFIDSSNFSDWKEVI